MSFRHLFLDNTTHAHTARVHLNMAAEGNTQSSVLDAIAGAVAGAIYRQAQSNNLDISSLASNGTASLASQAEPDPRKKEGQDNYVYQTWANFYGLGGAGVGLGIIWKTVKTCISLKQYINTAGKFT